MNFLFFGLAAASLFIFRRREASSGAAPPQYRAPGHPWTTGLFVLASVLVVASSFWSFPINSLIGYAIMLAGVPAYLFWRRQNARAISAKP
jgi:APA family basic amino acid/polyamine antiporter